MCTPLAETPRRIFPGLVLLLLLVITASTVADSNDQVHVLADFESGMPAHLETIGGGSSIESNSPARGSHCLRLTAGGDPGPLNIRFQLPRDLDLTRFSSLSVQVRASGSEPTLKGRWLATDTGGKVLFRRSFTRDATDEWSVLEEPLSRWIWSGERVGAWRDVAGLTLSIEASGSAVFLDDLRLTRAAPTTAPASEAIVALAFPRDRAVAEQDGLVVATDVESIRAEDLKPLLDDMRRARVMIRRIFADSVRPIGEPHMAYLFIFRTDASRAEFFARLGRYWRANIASPRSPGYTVQSIATATWDPKQGLKRPVFLHEAVHAVAAHDLRLLTGHPPHTWMQEGLASYMQVCVYPRSLEPGSYQSAFARPLGREEGGQFDPLATLFGRRAEMRDYAQLASIIAYLAESRPALLAALARGLADGQTVEQVLHDSEINSQQLELDWLQWGKQRYPRGAPAPDRHFDLPPEFQDRDSGS